MSGLIFLTVLAVYAAIVIWIATRFKRAWIRWAIVLAAVFGPFVESTIGKYRVAALCRAEYGVYIVRPITDLDGIFIDDPTHLDPTYYVKSLGLTYQEYPGTSGATFVRYSIGSAGQEVREELDKPEARYELRLREVTVLAGNIGRSEMEIVDRRSGEVAVYSRDFTYLGDWYVRFFRRSGLPAHSSISCGRPIVIVDLIRSAKTGHQILPTERVQ